MYIHTNMHYLQIYTLSGHDLGNLIRKFLLNFIDCLDTNKFLYVNFPKAIRKER